MNSIEVALKYYFYPYSVNALLAWSAVTFANAVFCSYEQVGTPQYLEISIKTTYIILYMYTFMHVPR